MPLIKTVLGLDLGSHSIKAAEFRQTLRGLEATQLWTQPLTDAGDGLAKQLHDFLRAHPLSTEHVICALPGDRISIRRLQFPFRDRRRLAQAIPFEVEGSVPFDLEDVVVAWEAVGGDRNRTEVAAAVARRGEVSSTLSLLREAGCEPRVVEAEGLVLSNLGGLFDLAGARLLVDLGHRKTTLCLAMDGRPLMARAVPVGGLAITRGIASDRNLSEADAERLKCEEGIFHSGFQSASPQALTALDRISREIIRTLSSLESTIGTTAAQKLDEITLLGGSARLHRVDEYIAERTGVPTARLALPKDPEGAALVAAGDPLLYAQAIALGLRGTSRARTAIDFRQGDFAFRHSIGAFTRDLRPSAVLAGVALGLLLVSGITSSSLEARREAAVQQQIAQLYAQALPNLPLPEDPVAALRRAVSDAHRRAEFLGVYRGNLSALDLLAEISARVPKDLDVVFEELSIDRQVIRLRVYSKSFEAADRLRTELAGFAPFALARVSGEVKTDAKRGGKTFTVTISLSEGEDT